MFQLTSVPVLSDVVVTFLTSIVVWTPNGQFWGWAITAVGQKYVLGISEFLECSVALNRDWIHTVEIQITNRFRRSINLLKRHGGTPRLITAPPLPVMLMQQVLLRNNRGVFLCSTDQNNVVLVRQSLIVCFWISPRNCYKRTLIEETRHALQMNTPLLLTFWRRIFFSNFSTSCI